MRIRSLLGALAVAGTLAAPAWAQGLGSAQRDPTVVVPQTPLAPTQNPELRRPVPEVVRVDPPRVVGRDNFQKQQAPGVNDPIQVRDNFNPELRRSVQQVQ